MSSEALRKINAQRLARLNGKEIKDDDKQSLDEIRAENVENILQRTAGFTPVNFGTEEITYSLEVARAAARSQEGLADRPGDGIPGR